MTSIRLELTGELGRLEAALGRVRAIGAAPEPLLKQIGIAMESSTRARFRRQQGPDGQAWRPLNPGYAAIKRGPAILQEHGMAGGLMGSIGSAVQGAAVVWGTNKIYGAIHQFGGVIRPKNAKRLRFMMASGPVFARSVTIPARPYLGLDAEDRAEIGELAALFLRRAMRAS